MVKIAFFKDDLEIPESVEVTLEGGHHIKVKGPKGDITTRNSSLTKNDCKYY